MPKNKDLKTMRDTLIRQQFHKLYHVEKKQFKECLRLISEEVKFMPSCLSPATIEDIIRKTDCK